MEQHENLIIENLTEQHHQIDSNNKCITNNLRKQISVGGLHSYEYRIIVI